MAKSKISIYLLKDNIVDEDDIFKDGYDVLYEFNEDKILYY